MKQREIGLKTERKGGIFSTGERTWDRMVSLLVLTNGGYGGAFATF